MEGSKLATTTTQSINIINVKPLKVLILKNVLNIFIKKLSSGKKIVYVWVNIDTRGIQRGPKSQKAIRIGLRNMLSG